MSRTYEEIVAEFRHLTRAVWPETERCCRKVRDGAPECCYQIVDGADLTFTDREVPYVDFPLVMREPDSLWVIDRSKVTEDQVKASLRNGVLADTLECASHPTRPVVLADGSVVAVAVIDACNGPVAYDWYRADRKKIHSLWTDAVDMLGVKPYYVTTSMRQGWRLL